MGVIVRLKCRESQDSNDEIGGSPPSTTEPVEQEG